MTNDQIEDINHERFMRRMRNVNIGLLCAAAVATGTLISAMSAVAEPTLDPVITLDACDQPHVTCSRRIGSNRF